MGLGSGFARLLLFALLGWTALGTIGVTVSLRRGERVQGRRNLLWIIAIWLIYMSVLLTASLRAKSRALPPGQEHCFDSLCFSVLRTEIVPGYLEKPGEHLLRIYLRIANHSSKSIAGDSHLKLYLDDSNGRRWEQAAGLEGVHLSSTIGPGSSIITAPIFKVAEDADGLTLALSHGRRLPNLLIIGDPDSLLHPPVQFSIAH